MITIVINPNFAVVGVNVELFTEFVICEIWVLSALCFTMIAFLGFLCFLSKSGSFFSFIEMMDLQEETGEVKIEDQCVENKQSTPASCSSVSEGSAGSSHKSPTIASPATVSPTHRYLGRTSGPIRRAKGGWTPEEDETLRQAVDTFKGKSWKNIGKSLLLFRF